MVPHTACQVYNSRGLPLFETITAARTGYIAKFNRILELSCSGNAKAALNQFDAELAPVAKTFFEATDAEAAFNKQSADQSSAAIMGVVSWASGGMLICLSIGVVAAIGIAWFITRGITVPLGIAIAHLARIADGDLASDAPPEFQARGDEICIPRQDETRHLETTRLYSQSRVLVQWQPQDWSWRSVCR